MRNYVFVAPPPMWKPQGAPNAAPSSELLDFEPFGKASSGAGFGAGFLALPNGLKVFITKKQLR